ncbi:MAG TPA: nucleoside-diphosphate kinase [Prolixibacteraceae bacterium]|nr:nucleoside-diphosphate kinase [Prolixibacteraceae bacterium]HPS13772.1 nucleoside-diphosphate kinase [Prolixibacteraceae bacterium]
MRTDLTFTIVKPTAFKNNYLGPIIELFNRNGFKILGLKLIRIEKEKAELFYKEHVEKPFFGSLIQYMTSGPVVVAVLQKENAVADFREMIGNTDPLKANFGTIRKMFAEDKEANAVHGSDSNESAEREISVFFSPDEILF